jgi:hypothetical protein
MLNICMTLGLAPITGMTLPFVSAGGSSLWANFLALGLLVNVAQRRPMLIAHPPFEHRDDWTAESVQRVPPALRRRGGQAHDARYDEPSYKNAPEPRDVV